MEGSPGSLKFSELGITSVHPGGGWVEKPISKRHTALGAGYTVPPLGNKTLVWALWGIYIED